jgi:tetratricopeptide (TPR) repeat protein
LSAAGEVRSKTIELGRAQGARARMVADELASLLEAQSQEPIDRRTFENAREVLASAGFPTELAWKPLALSAGETWALLVGPREGEVGRLKLACRGPTGVRLRDFAPDAVACANAAVDGLADAIRRSGGCPGILNDAGFDAELDLPGSPRETQVQGPSIGLATCVCAVSALLGTPAFTHVAGTAQVLLDGRLHGVEGLESKAAALRARWPNVTTLVVAAGQTGVPAASGLSIVGAATVEEALGHFGLGLEGAPFRARYVEDHQQFLDGCTRENRRAHDTADWLRLARRARDASHGLEAYPDQARRAALWAALFAVHAGAADVGMSWIHGLPEPEEPDAKVLWGVAHASARIDDEPEEAIGIARRALRAAEADAADGRGGRCLGMAHGTYGRALLHAGHFEEALGPLRDAVRWHRDELPDEEPRSMTYEAQCLRMLGREAEALAVTDAALGLVERRWSKHVYGVTTTRFLRYERGRCLAALGRPEEAARELEAVREGWRDDASYPRIGATRAIAACWRAMGDVRRAGEALGECVRVAERAGVSDILRDIAALAAGDALLDPTFREAEEGQERARLERVWGARHADATTPEQIRRRVRSVY